MSNGILYKTKAVCIGPMEADIEEGRKTRESLKQKLSELGIILWDHYNRPYVGFIEESKETHKTLFDHREREEYEEIEKYKDIRAQDLNLIDRADMVICVFNQKTFSAGTLEELFLANRMKKPIFLVWGEGKNKCPFWFFWTIPHKYIYSSVDEVVETLARINSGEKEIDSSRWRLFKEEYR